MRIKLTRSILLGGEHAGKGEVYEISRLLAFDLIGQGSAVQYLADGEQPEPAPTLEEISRMQDATVTAPKPLRIVGAKR
jgi:hypothetical protein